MRETRVERVAKKKYKTFNISLVTTEIKLSCNIGQVIRSSVCFGAKAVHVIGHVPSYRELKNVSASTSLFIDIIQHNRPEDFLQWRKKNSVESTLVSIELLEGAVPIQDLKLDINEEIFLVVGHETLGVSPSILYNSDYVAYIPMQGRGYCLNTGMSAHIALWELTRRVDEHESFTI